MTRVVVDSNVYISALVFGGAPQRVLDLLWAGDFAVYVSHRIMDEVADVLRNKFDWTQRELEYALPPLWTRSTTVRPAETVTECVDPDDNRVLECALAADASHIITGDDHLLRMRRFRGVEIVSPRVFLVQRSGR